MLSRLSGTESFVNVHIRRESMPPEQVIIIVPCASAWTGLRHRGSRLGKAAENDFVRPGRHAFAALPCPTAESSLTRPRKHGTQTHRRLAKLDNTNSSYDQF